MSDNQHILNLLDRFEKGLAAEAELAELDAWYNSFDGDERYTDGMTALQENLVQQQLLGRIRGLMYDDVPRKVSAVKL
jgi:hypothetical protein